MTFKVKTEIPKISAREKAFAVLKRKFKGQPPAKEIFKTGVRDFERFPQATHRKGSAVKFRDKTYIVNEVTDKGVYLQKFESEEGFLNYKLGKKEFVKDKHYSGQATPYRANWVFAPA